MIKIDNLSFRYAGSETDAIKNLSLLIKKGKYIAILGHNGSGKSTLSKILVGLYKPTNGQIEIDGTIMSKKTLHIIRKKIGIVFQNPENQFVGSTVEDDIAFGLENKKIPHAKMKKKVIKYAKMVNMLSHLEHEPSSLSGGQKQRVAIASTLALDPQIIIFDEVTSMLDPKGKKEVIEIIKKVQSDKKKTLISVTHDMDEAIMADEIIVLSKGGLVAQGDPKSILANNEIINIAKIDSPFIYKVSKTISSLKNVEPTYDREELLRQICK